jgi:hypothetical protein
MTDQLAVRQHRQIALDRLLTLVGDLDVRDVTFDAAHSVFDDLLPTTFWSLKESGVLEWRRIGDVEAWRMNHNGWAEKLLQRRTEDDPEFNRRKGAFCRAVKNYIDGRHGPVTVPVSEFATRAELPVGWCWNAIRGNLFCRVKDAGRYGQLHYDDNCVTLPPTWGQER